MSGTSTKAALYRIVRLQQGHLNKANVMASAEDLERHTKGKGRVNGVLGQPGLRVLRVLLRFANPDTGLCRAGYADLQRETGHCRQAITDGLRRLEAAGIVNKVPKSTHRAHAQCAEGEIADQNNPLFHLVRSAGSAQHITHDK